MDAVAAKTLCELELSATLENVVGFRDQLRKVWEENDLPGGVLNGLLLVVTELCNNACEYADPVPSRFYFSCLLNEDSIDILIKDDGQSFDPHDGVNPNFWNDAEEGSFQAGRGAGCYLVLHYFPDLVYVPAPDSQSGLNEIRFRVPLE